MTSGQKNIKNLEREKIKRSQKKSLSPSHFHMLLRSNAIANVVGVLSSLRIVAIGGVVFRSDGQAGFCGVVGITC